MNKIQKILWSIFSGMICMAYKTSYGIDGWSLIKCHNSSIQGDCTDPGDRAYFFTSNEAHTCRTISSVTLPGPECTANSNVILIASTDNLSVNILKEENACEQHYYQNTPTCSACTKAPINGVDEITLSMLYGPKKKITKGPYAIDVNHNIITSTGTFVNVCTQTGSDRLTFCIYQAISTILDEKGTPEECYVVPGTAQYSDQTGTYSYKDTACEYTE